MILFESGILFYLLVFVVCAWALAVCRERNIRPVRDLRRFLMGQSRLGRVMWCALALVMWVVGGTKTGWNGEMNAGDSGETNAENSGETNASKRVGAAARRVRVAANSEEEETQFSSEDFSRGVVITRIGAGENFDFAPPAGAVIGQDWRAFGAAEDWIYLNFNDWAMALGTNEVNRFRVISFGKVNPIVSDSNHRLIKNNWFAPFQTKIGIVPEGNWGRLVNATNSLFWHSVTPSNTLQLTWYNVLLNRLTEPPVSFQAELWPLGRFVYRYDLSRLNVTDV